MRKTFLSAKSCVFVLSTGTSTFRIAPPPPPPSSVYSTRFTHFIAHIRYCIFHSQLPLYALCLSINTWVLPLTTRCAGRPILSIFVSALVQPHCRHLSSNCKYLFYSCYILPFSDYCDTAWYSALSVSALNKLEVHHRLLLKILHNKDRPVSSKSRYHIARTTPLITRHKSHLCSLIHKIYLQKTPSHMQMYNCFLPSGRTRNNLGLPPASTSLFLKLQFFLDTVTGKLYQPS